MSAYSKQRVLVAGGFGYIGSNLTAALIDRGAVTTIVTPLRERHAAAAASYESRGAQIVEADVRDVAAMQRAVEGQTVVFNVTGRSGALASVQDPAGDLDVNVGGGLALLEAIRTANASAKLVFAGSRLVYGAPATLPVSENHPVAPLCPHGLHKAAVEQYIAIYEMLHGVRATCLRITNPYGPGQPSDRRAYGVINYLIHYALRGEALPIYGAGTQLRDYVFIGDVIDAMLLVGIESKSDGRTYNVGSGTGTRLIDAARSIVEIVGGGRIVSEAWPPVVREIDSGDFVADVSRIRGELGWAPAVALREGLQRTVSPSIAASANS
jgi:nucleoside-diphosphate-sugar epimerase